MKKKFLIFLSALLALMTLLMACSETPTPPAGDTTAADTTGAVEDTTPPIVEEDPLLALVENKQLKASVVYPENASDAEKIAAGEICNWLNETYGVSATMKNDSQPSETEAVEILVGRTNYTESQDALAAMKYNEWVVKTVGNKILVCAHLTDGIESANWEFMEYLKYQMEEDALYVERELVYSGTVTNAVPVELNVVPKFNADPYARTYDTGDNCQMTQYVKISADDFVDYEVLLSAAGYRKISSYDFLSEDNKYAHYANDDTILNVYYNAYDETARVFVESATVTGIVPATAGQYDTVSGYSPKLLQVGISDPPTTGETIYNGECYMFYLADGSFVVFDGGWDDTVGAQYNRQNARRIMEIVKSYTPAGKKPTIAAWILTHGHNDHFGALQAFDKLGYNDIVTVESVICNLPSAFMYQDTSDVSGYTNELATYRACLQEYAKNGTALYKAHPGQIFPVRNVDLQIVFTPELRVGLRMGSENNSSIVTRVVVKDAARSQTLDTVMITGDMQGGIGTVLANLYGESMHCNLVQMPHHGWYGSDKGNFWPAVKANYILWPCGEEKANKEDNHGHVTAWEQDNSAWLKTNLLNNNMNSDKIFWAFYDTVVFELPFTGQNFTRTENILYS